MNEGHRGVALPKPKRAFRVGPHGAGVRACMTRVRLIQGRRHPKCEETCASVLFAKLLKTS
jgi:hypothetical protein